MRKQSFRLFRAFRRLIPVMAAVLVACGSIAEGETMNMTNNEWLLKEDLVNHDLKMAEEKGLAEDGRLTDGFLQLQARYGEALFSFLNDRLDLTGLDQAIADLPLHFLPAKEEHRDVKQGAQSYGMQFFFLLNSLCIERLDPEDLEILRSAETAAEVPEALIEKTWIQVILRNPELAPDTDLFWDITTGEHARNDALILGFASSPDYDENGMFRSVTDEMAKDEYLKMQLPLFAEEMTRALGHPVAVILVP